MKTLTGWIGGLAIVLGLATAAQAQPPASSGDKVVRVLGGSTRLARILGRLPRVIGRRAFARVLVAAVLAAAPVNAQHVGITAGVNMAEINASGDERLNVLLTDKLELVGGIVLRGDVSDMFSIQAEALYSVKGTRFDVAGTRTDIDLNYLEVPVLVRFGPPADGPAGWLRLFGGPYVARLLGARVRTGSAPSRDLEMNAWDFGWIAGIGAAFGPLNVDFRYGGGISDLDPGFDDLVPLPTSPSTFRNRGFALLAAYVF